MKIPESYTEYLLLSEDEKMQLKKEHLTEEPKRTPPCDCRERDTKRLIVDLLAICARGNDMCDSGRFAELCERAVTLGYTEKGGAE